MNLDDLQRKLIRVARASLPGEGVPYGFERRVMAALRSHPVLDQWAFWAQALWRATAPCLAVVVLIAMWSLLSPGAPIANPAPQAIDVEQDLENTVLAATDQEPAPESLR
jgi:peptidoglycan/LPS O-acetylase OafA/YrhL